MRRAKAWCLVLAAVSAGPASGQVLEYAFGAGGSSSDTGWSIAVDAFQNAYVTGGFTGTADFDGPMVTGQGGEITSIAGSSDIFVARYDAVGILQWAASARGAEGQGIAVDAQQHVYVTGSFADTADFDGPETTGQGGELTGAGSSDIFVAKYTQAGPTNTIEQGELAVPARYALAGNHPNPFNLQTTIRFAVSHPSPVRLAIYDVLGRRLAVLAEGLQRAGWHEVVVRAGNLPNGTYVYRLETPQGSFVKQMMLVK